MFPYSMKFSMIASSHYFQILDSIIRFITVEMVNFFAWLQFSLQVLFHNQAMLRNIAIFVTSGMARSEKDFITTAREGRCLFKFRFRATAFTFVHRTQDSFLSFGSLNTFALFGSISPVLFCQHKRTAFRRTIKTVDSCMMKSSQTTLTFFTKFTHRTMIPLNWQGA